MIQTFKYKYSKGLIRWSVFAFLIVLLAIYLVRIVTENHYLFAWIMGVFMALVIFATLSIPRFIKVGSAILEIHCLLEMTQIPMEDIVSVSKIERNDIKWVVPIIASCGFCGHFGYYLDLRNWNTFKVYASSRKNLVAIQDIYEDIYLVNCDQADELIEVVMNARNARRQVLAEQVLEGVSN
ncbi:MAG: PH domain-containing protein [Rikenellaceae bacterium]